MDDRKDSDPELDQVTRELRRAFKLVNRVEGRRDAKAQKAEDKAKRKAEKLARLRENRGQAARREAQLAELMRRLGHASKCAECKADLPPIEDDLLPRLCKRCAERDAELESGFRARAVTPYSEVTVVPGGAPGTGKRK